MPLIDGHVSLASAGAVAVISEDSSGIWLKLAALAVPLALAAIKAFRRPALCSRCKQPNTPSQPLSKVER